MPSQRRHTRLLAAAALAAALAIPAASADVPQARPADVPAPPTGAYAEADYLRFADRVQLRLDRLWDEERGLYEEVDSTTNANLLLTHSVAALRGSPPRRPSSPPRRQRSATRRRTGPAGWPR
jgi:hypothetical protein